MTIAEPAPDLSLTTAAELLADLWDLAPVQVRDLGSHQDRNVLVLAEPGRLVLKVANAATDPGALDAQDAALMALDQLPVRLPRPVPSRTGRLREVVSLSGQPHSVRLLTYVEGLPLTTPGYLAPRTARALGEIAGRVSAGLARFDHPGAHVAQQWDVRRSAEVVTALATSLPPDLAETVLRLSSATQVALAPVATDLPVQVIHGDITDFNVVADPGPDGRPVPAGVIDFGDLMHTWRAAEVAVTICASLVKDHRAPLRIAADVLVGFLRTQPLEVVEVEALWPMVVGRACAGLAGTAHQLRSEPDNPYLAENLAVDRQVLALVAAMPLELGTAAMRRAAGLAPRSTSLPAATAPLIAGAAQLPAVDLSPTSALLDDGGWADPPLLSARIRSAAVRGGLVGYGQAHVQRAPAPSLVEPATVHLGVDVVVPVGTEVSAPWPCRVVPESPGVLRLAGTAGWDVVLGGVTPRLPHGSLVRAGATVAAAAPAEAAGMPDHVHVQLVASGLRAPTHCAPSLAPAWSELCPDPGPCLLGLPPAGPPGDPAGLLRRREAVLAGVQEHYWAAPPQVARGWRHHLVDTDGRSYLDAVNNVAVLGHSHPAVADAVSRQLRTLNTNSRFHQEAPVRFAELLLETLPAPLDRVLLVSTGSEAVDLALRLARVATGSRDTIALRTGYHGWTTASDEISSALMDNPNALGTRPPWVHLAEPPNLYRGAHLGPDAATRYADDVRRILAELAAAGRSPAAFVCEALNGNAGGIELPVGYLAEVYADVRAAGGLVIADEVQVGYGRLGSHFWGFQAHGVVPDIVCLAKATGNGVPVAAVVCRAAIAESFTAEGSFFSSMGGTPLGAVAGIATLQALRDEDLPGNAVRMGARLRGGLEQLVERHAVAGAVHGRGLYLGLELVTDRASRTPATAATAAICERLRTLGVVMAATGDHRNVLKIKPPLCIDAAGVDHLLAALEAVLSEGW